MHPSKVDRNNLHSLTDLPNVGAATAGDLRLLGIHSPSELVARDPYQLYEELCTRTGERHDPCVIDVFMSIIQFMEGEPPKPWWAFTSERKLTRNDSGSGSIR